MKLTKLEIELIRWGEEKGQYKAAVKYEGQDGSVELLLDNNLSTELLKHTGDAIRKFSASAADKLSKSVEQSVAEARAIPALHA